MVKYIKNKFGTKIRYKIMFRWEVEFTLNTIDPITGNPYHPEYYTPQEVYRYGMIENSDNAAAKEIFIRFENAKTATRRNKRWRQKIKNISISTPTRKYIVLEIITNGSLAGVNRIGEDINHVPYNIPVHFRGSELERIYNYFTQILYNNPRLPPLQMNNENAWLYPPPETLGTLGTGRIICVKIGAWANGLKLY